MSKLFLLIGSASAALSVLIGAFAAHGLKNFLEESNRTAVFETAVKYQFIHSLGLLFLGLLLILKPSKIFAYSGWSMLGGMLLFSGSLYLLSLTGSTKLGMITPFGGILLVISWGMIFWGILNENF